MAQFDISARNTMFTFERVDSRLYDGGCNIMSLSNGSQQGEVLFIGKVITLFGELEFSEDYEDIFSVVVAAREEGAEPLYLEIYHGPSGAAIGGIDDDAHKKAAAVLAAKIKAADPSDFQWEGDYADVPVHINFGIKNGKVFYESEFDEL